MTIDEAIKICEEDAEKIGGNPQSDRHAERCRQLAEWLMEYKDLRAEQNDQYVFIHELMNELKERRAAVKRGKWKEHHATYIKQLDAWFVQAKCSCCGRYSDKMDNYSQYLDLEYCSHCGADMREEEGE